MHVRRFFCTRSTCAQKIFVERLPELCHPHAQRTKRLQKALCELGLKEGGQAGADTGSELGLSGSRDTIHRLVHQWKLSPKSEPHIIGLDDWAWKRRFRYGTLICDLEQGLPIDLLPDRTVETVSAWLKEHPTMKIISRDGSSEYASAIKKGAPQAKEVSDRWHLVKNLAAGVSVLLTSCLAQLRRAEVGTVRSKRVEEPSSPPRRPGQTRAIAQAQQARQTERKARYEHILELHKQGMTSPEIAQRLGVASRTIQRWIATGDIPYSRPRKQRPRLLDAYKAYVLSRWHQGCHNGAQLERELKAQGYKGSGRAMYRYLQTLETSGVSSHKRRLTSAQGPRENLPPHPLLALSASQATWLFFRKDEDLKPEEQENLRQLRQANPDLETAYQLVKEFLHMVHELAGEQLEEWLDKVEASHLQAFQSFVTGVQQDKEAVRAGLTFSWSNGPVEGHVNRLKSIKRSMYGQAELPLLKLRVLHYSPKSLKRKNLKKEKAQQEEQLKISRASNKNTNFQCTTIAISKVA